ncbi:MAG: hypothetical protein Kow00121_35610 [Elainellaceae cyanobacterium]
MAFETTDAAIAAEPTLQFSTVGSSIATGIVEKQPETNAVVLQFWTDDAAKYEWQISNRVVLNVAPQTVEDETNQVDADAAVIWNASRNFAGWVRGDFAGFGIRGTLFAASVTGGIDWEWNSLLRDSAIADRRVQFAT